MAKRYHYERYKPIFRTKKKKGATYRKRIKAKKRRERRINKLDKFLQSMGV